MSPLEAASVAPIFVGGASRSGKTLMRWILSSHRQIDIGRRVEMWPRYQGRFGDLDDPANLDRCIEAMAERRQIAQMGTDWRRVRADFETGEPSYARLFALVHTQHAEAAGKARFGDQAALIELSCDSLAEAFPKMRLIHLVRDPRDRYSAIAQEHGRSRRWLRRWRRRTTTEWVSSAGCAHINAERHPGFCKVVRYESLVQRPAETVQSVCEFVGEAYEPAMLRLDGVGRYDRERAASPDGSPISAAYVGEFHDRLGRRDLSYIQRETAGLMDAFGYEPVEAGRSAGARLVAGFGSRGRQVAAP